MFFYDWDLSRTERVFDEIIYATHIAVTAYIMAEGEGSTFKY
jgi:hypothetical protein